MDNNDLSVKNLRVTETTRFGAGGQSQQVTRVQYNLGIHGPFTLEYASRDFSAATAQTDIQKKQTELRALHTQVGGY